MALTIISGDVSRSRQRLGRNYLESV